MLVSSENSVEIGEKIVDGNPPTSTPAQVPQLEAGANEVGLDNSVVMLENQVVNDKEVAHHRAESSDLTAGVSDLRGLSFDSTDNAPLPEGNEFVSQEQSFSSKAVTSERKQQLILEARESRKEWLGRVPVPYRTIREIRSSDDTLQELKQTYAFTKLPTAAKLVSTLYQADIVEDTKALHDHITRLVRGDQTDTAYPTGQEVLETELLYSSDEYLRTYASFWKTLHEPACSVFVQSMRKAICLFTLSKDAASSTMRTLVDSLLSQAQKHATLKEQGQLARCLEAFVYGQCYREIASLYATAPSRQAEDDFQSRLGKLQFLTLTHLDSNIESLDPTQSVAALESLDTYFSVYDKLQCVLALYQCVTLALRDAMQSNGTRKAPSADDILPAIIYIVIQTRPANLLTNLQMIEELAPQEYLRGEAGYSFTNLYGAVQFLLDLDLEQPLNMSPSEWKEAMARCSAALQERRSTHLKVDAVVLDSITWPESQRIPTAEIRRARREREIIDLEWARRWHQEHGGEQGKATAIASSTGGPPSPLFHRSESVGLEGTLPPGFSRSYTYLSSRPEDLRLADLAPLLDEYKTLVQTTEILLAERAHSQRKHRKANAFSARKELYERICEADTSLVQNGSTGKPT